MSKIGSIYSRITPLESTFYRIDFTLNENAYDSDDEKNEWQWSYAIHFSYEDGCFLNKDEIPYDTKERYTCRTFWKTDSTTIVKMITDTINVKKARGDPVPPWSLSKLCKAADDTWYKYIYN